MRTKKMAQEALGLYWPLGSLSSASLSSERGGPGFFLLSPSVISGVGGTETIQTPCAGTQSVSSHSYFG